MYNFRPYCLCLLLVGNIAFINEIRENVEANFEWWIRVLRIKIV